MACREICLLNDGKIRVNEVCEVKPTAISFIRTVFAVDLAITVLGF